MDYRRQCLCLDLKRKALMGIREIHPYTFKSKFLSNKEVIARFSDCYKSLNFVSLGFVSCGNRLKPPLAISKITMLFGTKGRTCGSNHWCFLIQVHWHCCKQKSLCESDCSIVILHSFFFFFFQQLHKYLNGKIREGIPGIVSYHLNLALTIS